MRYSYEASGRDRRGRILRTPPGPRGSNGKEASLGAAGQPARRILFKDRLTIAMKEDLPVCNYEGSDYQDTFWDRGGRAYEDAVEAVALERLLPRAGRCLLELGAGAGRNTPRYRGFEQVVLVDYSFTQLQQARRRLGEASPDGKTRYRFVAADIYHLPFVAGLFDTATMIRTLHHMVEPRLALEQVRGTLQREAFFILEFANKRNLKSILRYTMRLQSWNPFSPEPIEFAPLNFDFHPATVRAWLQVTGFVVERQLTVSHFRMGIFKRLVPLKILVAMDALAQHSGDAWQLSPSVFVRSKAMGADSSSPSPLGKRPEAFFRCPGCGNDTLMDTPPVLVCPGCGQEYPVKDGIYDFRLERQA